MKTFDVAIVGAGPAGAVAARCLALSGHQVLLIDDTSHVLKVGESLPGSAYPLLFELGLLPWLHASQPLPCVGNVVSWGQEALYCRDFMREPYGAGWHLCRQAFDAALRNAAGDAGVTGCTQRFEQVQRAGNRWLLTLREEQVGARWVIDASGRSACVARRLGVKRERDQRLIALYSRTQHVAGDQRTCIEAVANGWWYSAALPGDKRIAALHLTPCEAQKVLKDRHGWLAQWDKTRHIRRHSGSGEWSPPHACEAGGSYLQQVAGEHWLAVGDAALAFDPLSAQGIFNALYSAMRGAQTVQAALAGQHESTQQYTAQLLSVRRAYVRMLDIQYRREQRWADQAFWQVRQQ